MREAIIRVSDSTEDVEILANNLIFENEIVEKKITLGKFAEGINNLLKTNATQKIECDFLEPGVIGFAKVGSLKKYIINQPEHRRYITYSVGKDNQAYEINFPSSIYVVYVNNNRITSITAFMYLTWEGKQTKLYDYAMANMLSDSKICIGNAEKTISNDSIIYSLEKIIYAPYSHETLNNIKGFRSTKSYFDYLENNHIQEKYLHSSSKKLVDILKGRE